MARTFTAASSHTIATAVGGLSALTSGTVAVMAKRGADGAWHSLVQLSLDLATSRWGLELDTANKISLRVNGTDVASPTLTATVADGWVLLVATKAAGTATPRFHKYVFSTNTWSHENAAGTSVDVTAVGGSGIVQFGRFQTGSLDFLAGDLAAAAFYSAALSDAQIESMAAGLHAWRLNNPAAMWVFDQQAVGTSVSDLTGGGANQSSITGTAVSTSSAPINYGLQPIAVTRTAPPASTPPVFRASSGAGGTGTAGVATLTIPAAVQIGDVMVIAVSYKLLIATATINTPTGWTQVAAPVNGPSGNTFQGAVYMKVAVSGDPGSTLTVNTTSASQQINVGFAAYSGALGTLRSSSFVVGSTTAATSVTATAPGTAPQTNDLVVLVGAARGSTNGPANAPTFTGPNGATIRGQSANTSGSAQNTAAFVGDHNDSAGDRTVTASGTAWAISGQLVLKPSGANTSVNSDVAEDLVLVDDVAQTAAFARAVAEGLSLADATGASVTAARAAGEGLALADGFGRGMAGVLVVGEGVGLADALARSALAYARPQTETLALANAFGQTTAQARPAAEAVTVADTVARGTARARAQAETLTQADVFARAAAWARADPEALTLGNAFGQTSAQARPVAEAVTVADTVARGTARARAQAEAIAAADVATRTVAWGRAQAEALTAADGFGRTTGRGRALAEAVALADAVARGMGVSTGIAATLTLSSVFGYTLSRSSGVAGALTLADGFARQATGGRALAEALGVGDTVVTGLGVMLGISEAITLAATFDRSGNAARGVGNSVVFDVDVDAGVAQGREVAEVLELVDEQDAGLVVLVGTSETLTLGDAVGRAATGYGRDVAEGLTLAAVPARLVARGRDITHTLTLADGWAAGRFLTVGVAESISVGDGTTRAINRARTLSEAVAMADARSRAIDRARAVAEALTLAGVWQAGRVLLTGTGETLTLADALVRAATGYGRALAETLGLGNTIARSAIARTRGVAETLALAEQLAGGRFVLTGNADTLTLTDATAPTRAAARTMAETVAFANAFARQTSRNRGPAETLGLGDDWLAARQIIPAAAGSEIAFGDNTNARTARARAAASALTMAGAAVRGIDRARDLPETVTLSGLFTAVRGQHVSASSSVTVEDITTKAVAQSIRIAEAILLFDQAGAGVPGGGLIIAHTSRVEMTTRPHGRVRMTIPTGTVRRTV